MSFTWNELGLDEAGMPVHLPMSHTRQFAGPTPNAEARHWSCWCPVGHSCVLSNALRLARESGVRAAS
jgi:hypothetical protein